MKIIDNINVFGDSLSKGIVLDDDSKKYKISDNNAVDVFSRNMPVSVKNYSRFGCTTDKAVKIADGVFNNGLENDLFLVEFGGNDCDFNWDIVAENPTNKDIKPSVSLEQFKVNTQIIIDKLRKLGKRIAIMSLPPIDANKYFKWISKGDKQRAANILQFLGDVNFIYRHQELYAVAFKQIAIDNNIPVVPVRETLLDIHKLSDYICEDGIHLNEQGQAVVESVFENTYLQYHPETK